MRSKDAQKQLARTSLNNSSLLHFQFFFFTFSELSTKVTTLPDELDATLVNTVMHSRRSIPSMFVISIKKLPFDFGVVYNTKLVKY